MITKEFGHLVKLLASGQKYSRLHNYYQNKKRTLRKQSIGMLK